MVSWWSERFGRRQESSIGIAGRREIVTLETLLRILYTRYENVISRPGSGMYNTGHDLR